MDVRSRRARQSSPERAKICSVHQRKVISVKKVQVVYYLSRNGLLEHPHSMEVTLSPNEPLRLKHVLDRLIALRGSGMPSLYSWSCKRSYKSGYVWYDLGVNDIIHPADGAEYVLKGSELLQGCTERFQQLQVSNRQAIQQEPNLSLKRKPFHSSPNREPEDYEEYEEEEEEYEDGEKTSYTSSTTTPHSRCSRGVSTDELEGGEAHNNTTKVTANDLPLTVTSTSTLGNTNEANDNSKRFEEDKETGTGLSRNSVLLQLIACGSSAVSKAKNAPCVSNVARKKESLQRVAVRKSAEKLSEAEMINYMSENPRFGNSQSEEKEYFSGSLVESMKADWDASHPRPVLKKSNSYDEERSRSRRKVGEEEDEEEKKEKGGVKGKCMPRKRSSGSSKEMRK